MATPTYTKNGNKATAPAKLDKNIFAVEINNHELLKQAYVAYLANGRGSSARTKTRGMVSGGGKKPWRQKGTGRARFGSSRNPIWRGGGIALGPTGNENYSHKLSTASKRKALRQALTLANQSGKLIILEAFECKEPKTGDTVKLMQKVGTSGRTLLVVSQKDRLVERATSNIPDFKAIQAQYLTVFDIMNADHVVISQESLQALSDWLGMSKATVEESK